ncbi:MAG: hypothetical protein AAFP99_05530 [Pseudomonadota bacterium]
MELLILAIGVVAGVSLVIALVHLTGGSRVGRFCDEQHVAAEFEHVFPDLAVDGIHMTNTKRDALVLLRNDLIAHVRMMGDKPVVRLLSEPEVALTQVLARESAVVLPADGLAASRTVLQFEDRLVLSAVSNRISRTTN